jgi:hypothetical protein
MSSFTFWLPREQIIESLQAIAATCVCVSILHLVAYHTLRRHTIKHNFNRQECHKAAYQLTNFVVNSLLGLAGLYVSFFCHDDWDLVFPHQMNIHQRVYGYTEFKFIAFAAVQVGYNLWCLPVGIIFVKEKVEMIGHHIAVVLTCTLSALASPGFRIHSPFFLGVFEVISIALIIMNFLRDRHEWTQKNFKTGFDFCRLLFAFSFLSFRVVLGSPQIYSVIVATIWTVRELDGVNGAEYYRLWLLFVAMGQFFLAMLQYYWAYLIVSGLMRMLSPALKKTTTKKKHSDCNRTEGNGFGDSKVAKANGSKAMK